MWNSIVMRERRCLCAHVCFSSSWNHTANYWPGVCTTGFLKNCHLHAEIFQNVKWKQNGSKRHVNSLKAPPEIHKWQEIIQYRFFLHEWPDMHVREHDSTSKLLQCQTPSYILWHYFFWSLCPLFLHFSHSATLSLFLPLINSTGPPSDASQALSFFQRLGLCRRPEGSWLNRLKCGEKKIKTSLLPRAVDRVLEDTLSLCTSEEQPLLLLTQETQPSL